MVSYFSLRHRYETPYTLLERCNLLIGEGIGLGDDWDEVDFGVQPAHDFDVKRLQRVAGGLDEVDAGMNAVVHNVHAVDLVLSVKVSIEALLDVLDNRPPRIIVVDKVTKPRSVNNRQAETHAVLFNIRGDGLDADSLGCKVQ